MSKSETAPAVVLCRCECGEATTRPTAQYRPGHDARHAGTVARAAIETANELGQPAGIEQIDAAFPEATHPKLNKKALAMFDGHYAKLAEKAARAKAREAAKAAAEAAYQAALAK